MKTRIEDGRLIIDMAEADALWEGLTPQQQFDAMSAMFMPMLERAKEMKSALEEIKAEVGTSTKAWLIADTALKGGDA